MSIPLPCQGDPDPGADVGEQGREHAVLSRPPPAVSSEEALELAREHFDLDVRAIGDLPGERDANFLLTDARGDEYVLKVVHPAEDPAVTDFQARMLLHVEAQAPDLDLPRIIRPVHDRASPVSVTDIADKRCRVRCVTYIPGRILADTSSSPRQLRSLGEFAGRLDVALGGFGHPADDHDLLWDLKRAERTRRYVVDIVDTVHRARVERVFDRYVAEVKPRLEPLRAQVIHNDFNPQNVLTSRTDGDAVIGVIDFGDAVRAPLVQELAIASAYQLSGAGHPLDATALVCEGFHAVSPLRPEEVAILPDLIAMRLALSSTISSWRAATYPDNAPYILRNHAMVRTNLERLEQLRPDDRAEWLLDRLDRMKERTT